MRDTIFRVGKLLAEGQEGATVRTIQRSFLVSADMVRALPLPTFPSSLSLPR